MKKTEADYLKELVAFPTVSSDKKASLECAEFCNGFFSACGLYSKIIKSDGYPNVFASTTKTKAPKVLLQCHMDVVPAPDSLFKMTNKNGKLAGRGTFDMKFACASYMNLIERLGEDISKYDFGILLSFDEEIGGHNGVEAVLDKGYSAGICILPDSGKDWSLESSAHGAWFLKLSKTGKSAHASLPECGINSAEILTEAIAEVRTLGKKFAKSDLAISLTRIKSGEAMNQIPDYGEATLDIRFRSDDVRSRLKTGIEKICKKHGVKSETLVLAGCMNTDMDKPGVSEFIQAAEQVIGRTISRGHSLGTTDARYFCAQRIPCIVIQPDGGGRHSVEEWVDEAGVKNLTEILLKFIVNYAII